MSCCHAVCGLPSGVSGCEKLFPTCPPTAWLRSLASGEKMLGRTARWTNKEKGRKTQKQCLCQANSNITILVSAQLIRLLSCSNPVWHLTPSVNSYLCFREGDPAQTGFELSLQFLEAQSLLPVHTDIHTAGFRCVSACVTVCAAEFQPCAAKQVKNDMPGLCKHEVLVPAAADNKSYQYT